MASGEIGPVEKLAALLRDGFACAKCGEAMHDASPSYLTLAPFDPQAPASLPNLVTLCRLCKQRRGDAPAQTFFGAARAAEIARRLAGDGRRFLKTAKALIKAPPKEQ